MRITFIPLLNKSRKKATSHLASEMVATILVRFLIIAIGLNKDKNLNAATYFFIFAKMSTGLKILASPLDWGLGHATRLIPILKTLGEENELIIATIVLQIP
jgi:hypothetical protein